MTTKEGSGPSHRSTTESWDQFQRELAQLLPPLDQELLPTTTLGSLVGTDRIMRGVVVAAVRHLLHDPPDSLLAPTSTLHELYEWRQTRSNSADNVISKVGGSRPQLRDMRTANIVLRAIRESDIQHLHASAIDPRWSYRWRYRGATPSRQEFVAQLHQGVQSQFIIEKSADGQPVGLVTCYNARPDLGWAYVAFARISAPNAPGSDVLEGSFLFVSFLFRNWNFRKLYAEVPGWNWDQFHQAAGKFFVVEGVLKDHEYFDGKFWDQRIVAVHRSAWEEVAPALAKLHGMDSS